MSDASFTTMGLSGFFWARPLSTPLMIAVFVAVVLLSLYLYRKSWGIPMWLRVSLGLARIVALAVVVASLFEPTMVTEETYTQARSMPVLIDVSESMSMRDPRKLSTDIADAARALDMVDEKGMDDDEISMMLNAQQRQDIINASRLDLARGILTKSGAGAFESLADDLAISYHSFGRGAQVIRDGGLLSAEELASLTATESSTSIATSLEAVAKSGATAPAGIVLLTDGIENSSSKRAEAVLQDLGARGIPVYPVPVGLTDPDDISIRNIVMQEVAFSGDNVPIQVQLLSKGYEKRNASIIVKLNGRRVAREKVRLQGGLQFVDIEFTVDIRKKGAARVEIEIEPFDDEVSVANNRIERTVRVV